LLVEAILPSAAEQDRNPEGFKSCRRQKPIRFSRCRCRFVKEQNPGPTSQRDARKSLQPVSTSGDFARIRLTRKRRPCEKAAILDQNSIGIRPCRVESSGLVYDRKQLPSTLPPEKVHLTSPSGQHIVETTG